MKNDVVLVTGSSRGIGRAIAVKFLQNGYKTIGIDRLDGTIDDKNYTHYIANIADKNGLPDIPLTVNILINNAGVQNQNDIAVNLMGTINVTEKYGVQQNIKAIVNIASASAHTGAEFPEYTASKGGVLAYTKNVALRVAEFGATCNSISPGGVITDLNRPVIEDREKWDSIMALTPLKKWATAEEIADWTYFVATINKSMTAQDILIDNGEASDAKFVW